MQMKHFFFNSKSSTQIDQVVTLSLSNSTDVKAVWDVTEIGAIGEFENNDALDNIVFKVVQGDDKAFVTLSAEDYLTPQQTSLSAVSNQNLKGTIFNDSSNGLSDIDYLIITREDMRFQAERLADIHRNYNDLNVKVVLLKDIYKEFNTGNPDIAAIRNFIKYVYDRFF